MLIPIGKKMTGYDLVSDLHGCLHELNQLFEKLGYEWDSEANVFAPTEDRQAVFVGDIVDRGPSSYAALLVVKQMVRKGYALTVRGNHDDKLMRFGQGRNVVQNHGLDKTVKQLEIAGGDKDRIAKFIEGLPYFLLLDDGKLAVTHAAWKDSFIDQDPFSKKVRSYCIYGPVDNSVKFNEHDLPTRLDWAANRKLSANGPIVVYGHQVCNEVRVLNLTYNIDTGCVFGGKLSALRYPEMDIVQVSALHEYCKRDPNILKHM